MSLAEFLAPKPLFYDEIDYTRMPRAYESIKEFLPLKAIIHIVGTNGKGSTGRFLAMILQNLGQSVGHYTSPHIFKFNERFYQNGEIVSDERLENAHEFLQGVLSDEFKNSLSYFEYATFLAAVLFKDCDFVVFEAGMGSEHDATSVFAKSMSLFTPMGLDHTQILGDTIEKIAKTKFYAMAKTSIMNDEMNINAVRVGQNLAQNLGANLSFASKNLSEFDKTQIQNYANKFHLPKFQITNLTLAYSAAKALGFSPDLGTLPRLDLMGRMQKITPNITIDVGHNGECAKAIANELGAKKIVLVYNAFADKDIKAVLGALANNIKHIEIYEYQSDDRKLAGDKIQECADELGLEVVKFSQISPSEDYLVFGSFLLVENFLRNNFENLCHNN